MSAGTNIDTTLGTLFWREHPHLFIKAGWGNKYCRCCLNTKSDPMHTTAVNDATHPGNCTGYRVASNEEVGFAPVGWNDNGGACHFQMQDSYEDAVAFIEKIQNGGDPEGRTYEHWQIDERRYFTAVDTNVVVLS